MKSWAILFALIALIGCGLPRGGEPLVCARHDAKMIPPDYRAPYDATYHLYKARGDGTPEPGEPVVTTRVGRLQMFGFKREADGILIAHAGDYRTQLPEGKYVWTLAPECELRGWQVPKYYCQETRENLTIENTFLWLGHVGASMAGMR